jgi:Ca2+-binding EF-hand superfamily protein
MSCDDKVAVEALEHRRLDKIDEARTKWAAELLKDEGKGLQMIFDQIDTDNSGSLSQKELFRYFSRIGKSALVEQGKHLFDEMDANNDGEVTVEELKSWLNMDHRTAGTIKREADQRRESMQRTTAVSHKPLTKTMDASTGQTFMKLKNGQHEQTQKYVNGKPVTGGRRTSQALGGLSSSSYIDDAEEGAAERALKNRDALRLKLQTMLIKCVPKTIFGKLDAIPIKEFARKLDRQGLKFVYQDGVGILNEMDSNEDGFISR